MHGDKLPVIIGLDEYRGDHGKASKLAHETCGLVTGYKIGLPNILHSKSLGEAVRRACRESLLVADLKLADIGHTMRLVASTVLDWADAVIAHAFVGVEGGLDQLKELLDQNDRKLVLVVYMSHPGARQVYDHVYRELLGIAKRMEAWGVVAPATLPDKVAEARRILGGETVIMAPGVGAQGAEPGQGIRAGADYEIIGRAVTTSPDPLETLRRLARAYH